MKKSFTIPLVDVTFYIYVGESEWKAWRNHAGSNGAKMEKEPEDPPSSGSGRSYGSWIWLGEVDNLELVAHELSHFVDDMMNHIHSDDGEFRAYISGWVHKAVFDWRDKVFEDAEFHAKGQVTRRTRVTQ